MPVGKDAKAYTIRPVLLLAIVRRGQNNRLLYKPLSHVIAIRGLR